MSERPTEGGVWGSYVEYLDALESELTTVRAKMAGYLKELGL